MILLEPTEIRSRLMKLPDWELIDSKISRTFKFANFPTAVLFVNKLVDPTEELDHHPEIVITYDRVRISLYSHLMGGLTDQDFELAGRINELY